MVKVFISTHGRLASGFKSAADILLGNSENVTVFDAFVDEDTVEEHLKAFYGTVNEDDQVFLLSDISCGSVNQTMYHYIESPKTTVITGINLSLFLELLSRDFITEKDIKDIVLSSREMLKVVKKEDDGGQEQDFFEGGNE